MDRVVKILLVGLAIVSAGMVLLFYSSNPYVGAVPVAGLMVTGVALLFLAFNAVAFDEEKA